MTHLSKEDLFTPSLPEVDVEIPGRGTVRVRAMTRHELHTFKSKDSGLVERKVIAASLVDPVLTVEDVARWQVAAPAGELTGLIEAIQELSGLSDGAAKQAYVDFRDEP